MKAWEEWRGVTGVDAIRGRQKDRDLRKPQATYPLRLPASIKAEVERLARADGISINQFVATAVAEKLAAPRTATYFAERRAHADFAAFDRITHRAGGGRAAEGGGYG